MKISFVSLSLLGASLLALSSCYSPKFMVDDDVYVLKPNEVPIGESLTDESSFSNFKNNQRNGNTSLYNDSYYILNNSFSNSMFFSSMFGMNYGWGMYRPGNFIYFSSHNGFSYDPWSNYYGYYNPYAYYNPYYSYYPYFGNYPTYGFGYGYGYGYGYVYGNGFGNSSNYGNGWGSNNGGNTTVAYNHHNAPRGSITGGFGSPNRLEGADKVKSTPINHTGTGTKPVSNRINSSEFIGGNAKGRTSTNAVVPSRGATGSVVSTGPNRSPSTLTPSENRGTISVGSTTQGRNGNSGFINGGTVSGGRSGISHGSTGGTEINNSRSGGFSGSSSGGTPSGGRSGGGSAGSTGGRRP